MSQRFWSTDDLTERQPLLVRPYQAGLTGWIVVGGAELAEIIAGIVTGHSPLFVTALVLACPVAVAAAVAIVQWRQVRSSGAPAASWWHLSGIAAALFTWLVYPTVPGALATASSARAACITLIGPNLPPGCLARAAHAFAGHRLAWWLTGAVILGAALLARRSRIAAWAAIPAALAGCLIAAHFLQALVLQYGSAG